jgi:hypothetical protein
MASLLDFRAGAAALAHLRTHGWRAGDIAAIPAAAGGPKGLALHGIDIALFADWLPTAPRLRHLIGASVGAWRMAAAAMPDPAAGLTRLADLYCAQRFPHRPSRRQVTDICRAFVEAFVADEGATILAHPGHRISVLAVRGKRLLADAGPRRALAGFAAAALANALSRRRLGTLLDRTWFFDPRDKPPLLPLTDFNTHEASLTPGNLRAALLASGTIPMVLDPVRDIAEAPGGCYWDGGIIDYHLHLPYPRFSGLVLYPHFVDYVVPGWLDKGLPWRRARGAWLDNVILVCPTRTFLDRLPNRKLPDRGDFTRYGADGQTRRIKDWRQAVGESKRLGEAFLAVVRGQQVGHVRAF